MHEPFGERGDDASGDRLRLGTREREWILSSTQAWMVSASCRPVTLANTAMAAPMMPSRGTRDQSEAEVQQRRADVVEEVQPAIRPLMAITYGVSPRQPFTRCAPARMTRAPAPAEKPGP